MSLVRPLTEPSWRSTDTGFVRGGIVVILLLTATPATANTEHHKDLYERLWPQAPHMKRLKLTEQIEQQLTEMGDLVGQSLDQLSHEMIGFSFDGRRRKAHIRIGGGSERFLTFQLASDIHFVEGLARVNTKIDLRFRGRKIELELPEVDVVPTSYRGERGVEIRLPLFRRRF